MVVMRHQFTFTDEDLHVLQYERFHHPHPHVQQKMEVVWLKAQGLPQVEIARLAGVSRRTVARYLDDYLAGGVAQLRQLSFHCPQSDLVQHQGELEAYFLENPPASVAQAQQAIEHLTGIRRGQTQVRQFLKKLLVCVGARSAASQPKPTLRSKRGFWLPSCNRV